MSRVHSSLFVLAVLFSAACGGSKPVPAGPSLDATDAGADMPATPGSASDTDGGGATTAEVKPGVPDPSAKPEGLALPKDAAKIDMKGKKPAKLEIKSDGTVSNGGKPMGKVSGMALQNADGKALLTVGSDGAVTAGDGGAAYGKFDGDDLTLAKGDKLAIGDDGTLTMTTGGKGAPLGKFDGIGTAKRAAILAAAFVIAPPAAEKPAAPAKPAGKPAAKPAGKK
jgi:hypothetical protein